VTVTDSGPTTPSRLRQPFGDFVLDTDRHQLLRKGSEVALSPKAFRVLELLVRHPGEVVTKDRLLDEVWADVHVLEGVVKVCVAEIRRALNETAANPRHLYTVQRRGYRFEISEVSEPAAETQHAPPAPACARCGATVADAAGFCAACGEPIGFLRPRPGPSAPQRRERHVSVVSESPREIRQLTVISCEGFAAAGGTTTPDGADLPTTCRQTCVAIARSLGGRISVDTEDLLVVTFGYPRSTEDDAIRAVRASLRILERVPALNARFKADPVCIRGPPWSAAVQAPSRSWKRPVSLRAVSARRLRPGSSL
jgi:DNA-binding winged helix-turn-helix (wHTH) protein